MSFLLAVALGAALALWLARHPLPLLPLPLRPPMLVLFAAAGAPFAVLGLVLGPGAGVITPPLWRALAPLTALALGWIGAECGGWLARRRLRRVSRREWGLAAAATAGTVAAVSGVAWLLAARIPALRDSWSPFAAGVLTLGLAAVPGPGAVALVARHTGAAPATRRAAVRAARLETALAVLGFLLLLAVLHPPQTVRGMTLGPLAWLAATVGTGGLIGVLYLALTWNRPDPRDAALGLGGALLLAAGVGEAAGLSAFVVCGVAAATIVNLSPREGRRLRRLLHTGRRPAASVLLFAAGALLRLPTTALLLAIPALAGMRILARWGTLRAAARALPPGGAAPDTGPAAVAQGATALALALSFAFTFEDPGTGRVGGLVTAVAFSAGLALAVAPLLLARARRPAAPRLTPAPVAPEG